MDLHELMKKEIETMRQLLSNYAHEEMLILKKEKNLIQPLMQERAELIQTLSCLRTQRFTAEELLPQNHEHPWEILLLRDQIITLLDRMSLQCSRNEMLVQLEVYQAALQPVEPKKKITLATLEEEDYNSMNE